MSSPDEWLTYFAARDAAGRAWIAAEHARIADIIRVTNEVGPVQIGPVIYLQSTELDPEALRGPAGRACVAAIAHGWAVKAWGSAALHPSKGDVRIIGLSARRHDERVAACWWNGAFDMALYLGSAGMERLAASAWSSRARSALTRASKANAEPVMPTQRGLIDVIEGRRTTIIKGEK